MATADDEFGSTNKEQNLKLELARTGQKLEALTVEVAAKSAALHESVEHQSAMSEILAIISKSSSDVQPVFDAIAKIACRLCKADHASIFRVRDGACHLEASQADPVFVQHLRDHPIPIDGNYITTRAVRELTAMHIADIDTTSEFDLSLAVRSKSRTLFAVPLQRDGTAVGVITIGRYAAHPFADSQINLVKAFADQAVIAIENARLVNELREALQQQTATSEVLQVINRSAADLDSVLNTLVESAARLCDADAWLFRRIGEKYHWAASAGFSPEHHTKIKRFFLVNPFHPHPGATSARAALEQRIVHIEDVLTDPGFTWSEAQEVAGFRSTLAVPLIRGSDSIGVLTVTRGEVRPFSDQQIGLLKTFADQAVIAIENARLFEELHESLEYQTATSEVLGVISRSPNEIRPVLDAIVDTAQRLCQSDRAQFYGLKSDGRYHLEAEVGTHPEFRKYLLNNPILPTHTLGLGSTTARAALEGRTLNVADVAAEDQYSRGDFHRLGRGRSALAVPLKRKGRVIGVITVARDTVRPFNVREVGLIETFASQAVIAINNVALFEEVQARTTELEESLDVQTAMSEVLGVISRSPSEIQPVLEVIVETAKRLCRADYALVWKLENAAYRVAAISQASDEIVDYLSRHPIGPGRGTLVGRVALEKSTVQIHDVTKDAEYSMREGQRIGQFRTMLGVPLLLGGVPIGVIALHRTTVKPFTAEHVNLVTTFADQAVIAINNVNLFEEVQERTTELSEALQLQTATSEVLKAISRSAFDLRSVLQTLVESAARMCDAERATITRQFDDHFYRAEFYGFSQEYIDFAKNVPIEPDRKTVSGRALAEGKLVHISDVDADLDYSWEGARELGEFRTLLGVPIMREGEPIGVLALARSEVRPFTEKQIELVSTFADQAAIAIENTRLFEQVQTRTRELTKSLGELRAAQDRLIQTEKLASLGQLTAGIAHEIKNPLNFVNNFSSLSAELIDELRETLNRVSLDASTQVEVEELAGMLKDNLDKVVQHGKRADSIVKNMLLHSRQGAGDYRTVDINTLVDESLNLAYHGARAENREFNITLDKDFDPTVGMAHLYPQEITRVLLNLISNGFYATRKRAVAESGNAYEPILLAATKNLGDSVEIVIRDNGTGIPPDVVEKMFDPFFTTKPAGEGTGLGLSLSHDIIVKQHAGSIKVESTPGQFSEFRIVLPREAASTTRSEANI